MILGIIFIWARFDKISHPEEFIKVVESYKLLPFSLAVIFAVSLPWVELISGLLLIAGVYTRSSATVLTLMLTIFMVAIGINLYRGADFACGCFNVRIGSDESVWLTLPRDILLIAMGLQILFIDQGSLSLGTWLAKKSPKITKNNP